jgi:hypothetical protein
MCEYVAGTHAYVTEVASQLKADGIPPEAQIFSTDVLGTFWLFGGFQPLQNGAPWNYGGLVGIENADYVLIPKCNFFERVHVIILNELIEADLSLTLQFDNEVYALFSLD